MATTQIVVLGFSPGSDYYDAVVTDPAGFIEQRAADLARVAGQRLHDQRWLPIAKGSPWAVILPGGDLDLSSVREMYGDELADTLARAVTELDGSAVAWQVVRCVPKGQG